MRSTYLARPGRRLVTVIATVAVASALSLAPATSSVAAASAAPAPTCKSTQATGWKAAVTKANAALAGAVTSLQHKNYSTAVSRLRQLKQQSKIAATGATAEIGKPPTDPESDDPPGPTAVMKVAGLDHQVVLKLVPLLDGLQGSAVGPLGSALNKAAACRDKMLGAVIALKPGARDDYTDGLSDTLPQYKQELTAISTTLESGDLTSLAHSALGKLQTTVTATNTAMKKAFGGGERPAL